jgi:hypothetical protein
VGSLGEERRMEEREEGEEGKIRGRAEKRN